MNKLTKLEEIEQEIYDEGIDLINYNFHSNKIKGLTFVSENKPVIGISTNIDSNKERLGVLSEELAHCSLTPSRDISTDHYEENKARFKGFQQIIGFDNLIKAYENGCRDLYSFSDYLDVTYEYLIECIKAYSNRYGNSISYKDYIILFNPYFCIEKGR